MSYLIDTNILLRSAEPDHPMFTPATQAVNTLLSQGEEIYITSQNIIEFWNVATRPLDKNGLGYSLNKTNKEISKLKKFFPLLVDNSTVFNQWERLVNTYEVKGVNVHDARLVAVMLVYNLTHILTFNINDFKRFSA